MIEPVSQPTPLLPCTCTDKPSSAKALANNTTTPTRLFDAQRCLKLSTTIIYSFESGCLHRALAACRTQPRNTELHGQRAVFKFVPVSCRRCFSSIRHRQPCCRKRCLRRHSVFGPSRSKCLVIALKHSPSRRRNHFASSLAPRADRP